MATISEATFSDHADRPVAVSNAGREVPWRDDGNRVGIKLRDSELLLDAAKRRFNLARRGGADDDRGLPRLGRTASALLHAVIRYYIDGAAKFGDVIYQPGDCVYFPEGRAYATAVIRPRRPRTAFTRPCSSSGPSVASTIRRPKSKTAAQDASSPRPASVQTGGKYRDGSGNEQDAFEATLAHT